MLIDYYDIDFVIHDAGKYVSRLEHDDNRATLRMQYLFCVIRQSHV